MHSYTERPKKGTTARLAWDLFVHKRNEKPESVEYSPNYSGQFKGWICNHYIADPQIKHLGYAGSSHYTFYHSSKLAESKDIINAYDYKEPPEHQPLSLPPEPTAKEIAEHSRLCNEFNEQVKIGYRQGKGIQATREAIFKKHNVSNMKEYLAKHGSHIYSVNSPNNPTEFRYYNG